MSTTYCGFCGQKYEYEEYYYHTENFMHPDNTSSIHVDKLDETPCPHCGKINKEQLELEDLKKVKTLKLSKEEIYYLILKHKIEDKKEEIKEVEQKINECKNDIEKSNKDILSYLSQVNFNKSVMRAREKVIKEIDVLSDKDYVAKQKKSIANEIEELNNKNIKLFINRKHSLSRININKREIEDLNQDLFELKKDLSMLEYSFKNR